MTDIANFAASFSKYGIDKYGDFDDREMENVTYKKHSEDTEKELADILRDLENIGADWLDCNGAGENSSKWIKFGRNSDDITMNNFISDYAAKEGKNGRLPRKVIGKAAAVGKWIRSLSFPNWLVVSSAGTLFGIFGSADSILRASCVALAIGCGSLPFVAYAWQISGQGGVGATSDKTVVESSFKPSDGWYKRQRFEPIDRVDPYAKPDSKTPIMSNGMGLPKADISVQRDDWLTPTAPKAKAYAVKDIVEGLAMIEYDQTYWFAKPGSTLPDGSRYVRALEEGESEKQGLITSKGIVKIQNEKPKLH
ncbi:hypothetical protein [uncultured Bartonella sp.]|uniref:hypothetical protein n=1 Tax=uncultured Bartonella sp. TaxID=104108 RepID=UPI00262B65D7|nr:hypothetical protein [uncultured Bartonella sp.]